MKTYFRSTGLLFVLVCLTLLQSQAIPAEVALRVEPPFWWAGMKHSGLQLLVYGPNIADAGVTIDYPGVDVVSIHKVENPNYLFIDLELHKDIIPGKFPIQFKVRNRTIHSYMYEIKERESGSVNREGFNHNDVIYLLMPDRFANGDPANDQHPAMLEKPDRSNPSGRHGGDIKGIESNLPYIKDLGVTAIWINPLLENNQPQYSYHGYAISDFYKIDPRFGTNDDYVKLVKEAHNHGLKIIMDMIFNHCGINHWFINDLPMKGWIHEFDEFTQSNFRAEVNSDPYASDYDRKKLLQGWFDRNMPDLDQRNGFLTTYLIQNSLWWIEYAGIDGIRMDTQPYPYKEMMAEWAERVFDEYPHFNIVGEAWMNRESMTSYYQKSTGISGGYNSNIPVITDFPLYNALTRAFTEEEGWTEGMARIYYVLAQDFLYDNPMNLLIFADNHDLNRLFTSINGDLNAYKMIMSFLLTTRGIPMIYYGTEFLMEGEEHKGHGEIRKDFPGGWPGDSINLFLATGRNARQNEAFNYLQTILKWRQTNEAVKTGALRHYIPQEGVYVYFRESGSQRVMVVINNSKESRTLSTQRFAENLIGITSGREIITGNNIELTEPIKLNAREALIIDLY